MREKELFLFYENNNRTLLPSLPKHKDKEKRQKIIQKRLKSRNFFPNSVFWHAKKRNFLYLKLHLLVEITFSILSVHVLLFLILFLHPTCAQQTT